MQFSKNMLKDAGENKSHKKGALSAPLSLTFCNSLVGYCVANVLLMRTAF